MSDTVTPPPPVDAETAEQDGPEQPAKPEVDWKAKAREWEKRAKENSTAAQRLAELEETQKTETQKAADRADKAEKEAAAHRSELMRLRVASAKGLSAELADRLRGDSEDELADDADRLLALLTPPASTPHGFDHGARTTAPAGGDMNTEIRRALGRR